MNIAPTAPAKTTPGKTTSVKEQMATIIQAQPDDSSYDEILKELVFALMIERGLRDSHDGRTIPNDEMKKRIRSWRA